MQLSGLGVVVGNSVVCSVVLVKAVVGGVARKTETSKYNESSL